MSWTNRVQNRIEIRTGDGQVYTPDYINPEFEQGYNLSEFEFRNVPGTLVVREQPKGRRFALQIIFQGDLHLEDSETFRQSTFDRRPWIIIHPKYDELLVHPVSLRFDNTTENITTITGTVIETIDTVGAITTESPVDEITDRKNNLDEVSAASYEQELSQNGLQTGDANQIQDNLTVVQSTSLAIAQTDEEAATIRNTITTAQTKLNNSIGDATGYIQDVQAAINLPFQIVTSVTDRINAFTEALDALPLINLTRSQKKFYETNGSTSLSGMCVASVTNTEYETRGQVTEVLDLILGSFNTYIENLDSLQTETATEIESYTPSEEGLRELYDVVNYTVSRLFEIAFGSKQELIYVVESDTNPILLTHLIYGLDTDDANLERLIKNNEIGINELFLIRKGRNIKYYA
jgi:hypothetical protein